jgi:hypothetical protein
MNSYATRNGAWNGILMVQIRLFSFTEHLASHRADRRKHDDLPRRMNSSCFGAFSTFLQKLQQVGVDLIRMRGGEAVRQARIVDFHSPLDQLC